MVDEDLKLVGQGRVKPRALITGVTGQDGWYLRELLEGKGYEVRLAS